MLNRLPAAFWPAAALCAALCLYSVSFRYRVESLNHAVSLVAEADQIESLAANQGINFEAALGKMRAVGLNGVVVGEETIGDLVSSGQVEMTSSVMPKSQSPILRLIGDVDTMSRIERGLRNRFDLSANELGFESLGATPKPRIALTVLHRSAGLVRSVSVGLEPQFARAAQLVGLDVVARHGNPPGLNVKAVANTLDWDGEFGARFFLPSGDQVLGRRDELAALIEGLERNKMLYCSPEFAKIGGDSNVLSKRPDLVVRLHAAQTIEIDKLTQSGFIERYAKAVSERNIRVALLRPLTFASDKPFDDFQSLTQSLAKQLAKEGQTLMPAHPFEDSQVPRWVFAAIGLSIAPVFVMVLAALGARRNWIIGSAVFFGVVGALAWFDAARNPVALLGSLAFPIAGFLIAPQLKGGIVVRYLSASALSTVGGLTVAGLLNGLPFWVRADQFEGVKLSVFLPLFVVAWVYFAKFVDAKAALRSSIAWSQAALGLLIVGGLAFMASRTGNDNPAGVSGAELKLRSILEHWLVVRPRTKEFLIGHPAMVVFLGLLGKVQDSPRAQSAWGGWIALLALTAAIGQTSVVNTLCHLHTPIAIGLTRIAIGLGLGGVLGGIAWLLMRRFVDVGEEGLDHA